MRFRQFLKEESNHYDVEIKDIIKNVDSKYLKHFLDDEEGNFIYRGKNKKTHNAIVISDNPKQRQSANTSNEFTLLQSHILPSWKNWPKREESFICSTNPDYAGNFGPVFLVLPFGNPDIGVCSKFDIWESFSKLRYFSYVEHTPLFNNAMRALNALINKNDSWKLDTVVDIKNLIEKIDKYEDKDELINQLTKSSHNDLPISLLEKTKESESFLKVIDELLNPDDNGFKKMTAEKLFKSGESYDDREVWFAASAAFIRDSDSSQIRGRMKYLMGQK